MAVVGIIVLTFVVAAFVFAPGDSNAEPWLYAGAFALLLLAAAAADAL